MKHFAVALAAGLAFTGPVAAGNIFDSTFARVDGGRPCYSRTYDSAHLGAHPRQTVSRIEVAFDPVTADGVVNTASHFQLGFGFQLARSENWYGSVAYCSTKSGFFSCSLESDGGLFHLTPQNGALKLDVINRGGTDSSGDQINVEGDDFAGFGKPTGDDLTFILPHAERRICSTSKPDG